MYTYSTLKVRILIFKDQHSKNVQDWICVRALVYFYLTVKSQVKRIDDKLIASIRIGYEVTAVLVDNGETRIFLSVSCALMNVYSETRVTTRRLDLAWLGSVWLFSSCFHRYDFVFSRDGGSNGGEEAAFPRREHTPLNPWIVARDISSRYHGYHNGAPPQYVCDVTPQNFATLHKETPGGRHVGVQYRVGVILERLVRGSNPVFFIERTDAVAPRLPDRSTVPRYWGCLDWNRVSILWLFHRRIVPDSAFALSDESSAEIFFLCWYHS